MTEEGMLSCVEEFVSTKEEQICEHKGGAEMTNAIAPIFDNDNGEVRISGRQLHMFLEVQTRYNDWFTRMKEYGFTEGVDFNLLKNEQVQTEGTREVRREVIDHLMNLSISKTPKVTGKGQVYFVNKFVNTAIAVGV